VAGVADVGGQQIVALLTRHSRERRQHVGRTVGWVGSSLLLPVVKSSQVK